MTENNVNQEFDEQDDSLRSRKNYPGDVRTVGTKDYGLILGNLMNYRNQLGREKEDDQKMGALFIKIAEKLKELGFKRASNAVKKKAGRRKKGKFQNITLEKKEEVMELALTNWHTGKERHEVAKFEKKEREKREKLLLKMKMRSLRSRY